jgi:hypothetical protein
MDGIDDRLEQRKALGGHADTGAEDNAIAALTPVPEVLARSDGARERFDPNHKGVTTTDPLGVPRWVREAGFSK